MPDDIDAIRDRMIDAAERAVKAAADDLLGRAQRDAPVDTGALRASGHVEVGRTTDGVEATVAFERPYAAAQEVGYATMQRGDRVVEWQARRHPKGGKSRYLGGNLEAMAPRYEAIIAEAVKQALE